MQNRIWGWEKVNISGYLIKSCKLGLGCLEKSCSFFMSDNHEMLGLLQPTRHYSSFHMNLNGFLKIKQQFLIQHHTADTDFFLTVYMNINKFPEHRRYIQPDVYAITHTKMWLICVRWWLSKGSHWRAGVGSNVQWKGNEEWSGLGCMCKNCLTYKTICSCSNIGCFHYFPSNFHSALTDVFWE